MPSFDCQLDHHPSLRIAADSPEAAKAEYFRLYAISSSTADWHCKAVEAAGDGSLPPAPVEPESWVKRRKELGTWEEKASPATKADQSPPTKAAGVASIALSVTPASPDTPASPSIAKKDSPSP